MKLLITGGKGQLASDMIKSLVSTHQVIALGKDSLDLTKQEQVAYWLDFIKPQVVINCASYTDVDGCEQYPVKTMNINANGVRNLAILCYENQIKLVHVSTDFIFDGYKKSPYIETDSPNPLNMYGQAKWIGEEYVRHLCPQHYILRTSWLFGLQGKNNFVEKILDQIPRKRSIYVVDDQIGTPTYTYDFIAALNRLLDSTSNGTYHIANRGACSRYEFAKVIVGYAKGQKTIVSPIHSNTLPLAAIRPSYSALSCKKVERQYNMVMPTWQNALKRYMKLRK